MCLYAACIVKRKKKACESDSTLCLTERCGLCRALVLSPRLPPPLSLFLGNSRALWKWTGAASELRSVPSLQSWGGAHSFSTETPGQAHFYARGSHPKKINGGIVRRAGPGRIFLLNSILRSPSSRQNEGIYTFSCCCALCHGVRKQVYDSKTEADL